MRIEFEDRSWIEFTRGNKGISISISAPHGDDVNSFIINTAIISDDELEELLSGIRGE